MKRLRVDEALKEVSNPPQIAASSGNIYPPRSTSTQLGSTRQALAILPTTQHNTAHSAAGGLKVIAGDLSGSGMQSTLYPAAASQVSYSAVGMPSATTPLSSALKPSQSSQIQPQQSIASSQQVVPPPGAMQPLRGPTKGSSSPPSAAPNIPPGSSSSVCQQQQSPSFQRLKVEDALSYLDQVKFKFGNQPQVYNDFLDIMKEFKSQSIDTPGVITRVSDLFKGYPELIVGFNTFLPPGYKIEVQANEQGYAFQVSVSMPSPTAPRTLSAGNVTHATHQAASANAPQRQSVMQIMQGSGTIIHPNMPASQPQAVASLTPSSGVQPVSISHVTSTPLAPSVSPVSTLSSHHSSPYQANNLTSVHNNHNLTQSQAAQQAVNQALSHVESNVIHHAPQNQPVEFNHAINYVNKIKNRFQGQPEKYKRFLEILHTYQKEQRLIKESGHHSMGLGQSGGLGGKHLTEAEVYSQVAKLFENQEDLLAEFGQFLPDATSHQGALGGKSIANDHLATKKPSVKPYNNSNVLRDKDHHHREPLSLGEQRDSRERHPSLSAGSKPGHAPGQLKRSPTYPLNSVSGSVGSGSSYLHHMRDAPPPPKRHKMASCRDVTLAEAGKLGTLNDYAFFDKVRKALRCQEVYDNFLRCLTLYNQEVVSKSELVQLVTPFLGKYPELFKWFKDFLGHSDSASMEPLSNNIVRQERPQGDNAMEIDLTTCKRLGASYCALPKSQEPRKCSGRNALCREVLNDQWVSFPTWSEDSTFVTSRKTQYEEYIYRCEDERFELDVVIETNAATIRVLEGVQKKLSRMGPDELSRFKLDECLGGQSPVIHQRALKRIYGDKAHDIIEGLKRNPSLAVQVVLPRLKAKEAEWREAQKGFNKIWREQNEKYYLKSLDHQGINFKQNDIKALRSKSLFNEIETLFDERHEQQEDGAGNCDASVTGPHMVLSYKDKTVLDDAANLLIHHVKRQTGIQKNEKQRIKHILRHFVPDLFFHPRQQLSDDEREDDDDKDDADDESHTSPSDKTTKAGSSSPGGANSSGKSPPQSAESSDDKIHVKMSPSNNTSGDGTDEKGSDMKDEDVKPPLHAISSDPEEAYTLFMVNNNWYVFFRLHAILCERLTKMYERALLLAEEEEKQKANRKDSTAIALRLKPKNDIEVEDYYPAFLDMVKNVLDGNMDSNAFEDTLREMFGIHAYIAFTLDKVVSYAVRQLQHCVSERSAQACMDMFQREQQKGGAGGLCSTAHRRINAELAYQRKAEALLKDENCFKVFIYKKDCKVTIELLDTETEDTEAVTEAEKWSSYVERYADSSINADPKRDGSDSGRDPSLSVWSGRKAVFLNRNLRSYPGYAVTRKNTPVLSTSTAAEPSANATPGSSAASTPPHVSSASSALDKDVTVSGAEDESARSPSPANPIEQLERKLAEKGVPQRVNSSNDRSGIIALDRTECKLNSATAKITFVVNKENYLYRKKSLTKARETHPEVTRRLNGKFRAWHKSWGSDHISDTQHKVCTDWLMGRFEGVVPNKTRVLTNNDVKRTPYAPYNRYKVERLSEDSA